MPLRQRRLLEGASSDWWGSGCTAGSFYGVTFFSVFFWGVVSIWIPCDRSCLCRAARTSQLQTPHPTDILCSTRWVQRDLLPNLKTWRSAHLAAPANVAGAVWRVIRGLWGLSSRWERQSPSLLAFPKEGNYPTTLVAVLDLRTAAGERRQLQ